MRGIPETGGDKAEEEEEEEEEREGRKRPRGKGAGREEKRCAKKRSSRSLPGSATELTMRTSPPQAHHPASTLLATPLFHTKPSF